MSKPEPIRTRPAKRKPCNAALMRRGSLLIWLDRDTAWRAPRAGRNGRPAVFSGAEVLFCLMVEVLQACRCGRRPGWW